MNKIVKELLNTAVYIVSVLCLTWFIITFIGQRTEVSGSSMENTLQDGDNLIVDKMTYRFKDPERFDIIVFPPQYDPATYYIKRIIGLPGETVSIDSDGTIYINGEVLTESYGNQIIRKDKIGNVTYPVTLGEDEYFVMGDNRNNSSDSREQIVGNIKRKDIIGRAWVRIWPLEKIGVLKHQ